MHLAILFSPGHRYNSTTIIAKVLRPPGAGAANGGTLHQHQLSLAIILDSN